MPPLFNSPELLSSASDKAKYFAKNVSKNSDLDDSVVYLPAFPSRTILKPHNISVTSKLVEKVITNLDSSGGSEELWAWAFIHISWTLQCLSEGILFSKIIGRSCLWSLYLRLFGRGLQLKTTILLVFFYWLVKFSKNL